jgi:hypothetical protein
MDQNHDTSLRLWNRWYFSCHYTKIQFLLFKEHVEHLNLESRMGEQDLNKQTESVSERV